MTRTIPARLTVSRVRSAMITGLMIIALTLALSPALAAQAAPQVRDFESDAVGAVPEGCTVPADRVAATVTDRRAHGGRHSLQLQDSGTTKAALSCPVARGAGADLRFAVYPEDLDQGFVVSLLGTFAEQAGTDRAIFRVRFAANGSASWYDGLGWTQFAAAGTISPDAWNLITVQVPTDHRDARIYIGGPPKGRPNPDRYVGPAGPVGVSPVASVTGYQFTTAGSGPATDMILIDDVSVDNGSSVLRPPHHPSFTLGRSTMIEQTDDGYLQMPNTAVSVPRPNGPDEVLVSYLAHADTTNDTGTKLASSLDNGRTWTSADDRNPFPDEQSFYLSRLRNGDLLAVSYHTFMIENSGETQAEVPTAVSRDGGRTWAHRTGRMTAPEGMRPISNTSSRPGTRLGGFVLVHRVIEDADGTLFQSGYGFLKGDTKFRQILLASTDGGENWTIRGTVANASGNSAVECFCEGAFIRTADGSLLSVMRTGSYLPLQQSRSTDDGVTWSRPEPVTAGPARLPVGGVFPDLILMDNGTLVLFVGRPGQSVLASTDGRGDRWTSPLMIDYLNSGNGIQLPIGRNQLLAFGDRGADWTPNAPHRKGVRATLVTVRPGS